MIILFFNVAINSAFAIEEPPPDSAEVWSPSYLSYHAYDGFDIGTYYPSFDNVFNLYLTDGVDNAWDSPKFLNLCLKRWTELHYMV